MYIHLSIQRHIDPGVDPTKRKAGDTQNRMGVHAHYKNPLTQTWEEHAHTRRESSLTTLKISGYVVTYTSSVPANN